MSADLLRPAAFLAVLALALLLERRWTSGLPRPLGRRRWLPNLSLVAIGSVLARLLVPAGAVGAALWAEARGIGLLHGAPAPLAWAATILLLDLAIYLQHRVFHAVPWLWRLHQVHHADPEVDATTGVRFHPLELLLSLLLKAALAAALGAPPEAVVAFEILLNASSVLTHADVALPPRLERGMRAVLVTPALHRIHHSERPEEERSHYGFCLSVWDRLLGTWRGQAAEPLVLGVPGLRAPDRQRLGPLLAMPLLRSRDGR